jgi:hypothetical protein
MKTDSGLFSSWRPVIFLDALHRYLLVKSVSLFDLVSFTMATLAHSIYSSG